MISDEAVEAAAKVLEDVPSYDHAAPDVIRMVLEAAAPYMLAGVVTLAEDWEAQGEKDMAFSKTVPDEAISMVFLTEGAAKVENARLIRNALAPNPYRSPIEGSCPWCAEVHKTNETCTQANPYRSQA